jgi:hypothetical protein
MIRIWQDNWQGQPLKDKFNMLYTAYNKQLMIKEAKEMANWDEQFRQPLSQQAHQQKQNLLQMI